jgi:predicted dehydrogenase
MIRLATIGTSGITERFADAVADVDGIRIDVAYSRDAARARAFADRLGIAGATTDLAALLRSGEIDAVYVGSPNGAHAAQVRDAIDAGIHVFVEKPATPTAGEFADLVGAARDRGVVVFEGMRNVYDPGWRRSPPSCRGSGAYGSSRSGSRSTPRATTSSSPARRRTSSTRRSPEVRCSTSACTP